MAWGLKTTKRESSRWSKIWNKKIKKNALIISPTMVPSTNTKCNLDTNMKEKSLYVTTLTTHCTKSCRTPKPIHKHSPSLHHMLLINVGKLNIFSKSKQMIYSFKRGHATKEEMQHLRRIMGVVYTTRIKECLVE